MLIDDPIVKNTLAAYAISGVLHVGAHDCEELPFYTGALGLSPSSLIWIDAIEAKVLQAQNRGIPNVYQAVLYNQDDATVTFHLSQHAWDNPNNFQSSSILEFGTHATEHPHVTFRGDIELRTTTLDTFVRAKKINIAQFNMWNLDVQGAELLVLQRGINSLKNAVALYIEVNKKELYKGCVLLPELDEFLRSNGFTRAITTMTEYGWGDAIYLREARVNPQ